MALSFSLMSPMAVNSDDRIYETKNICGRYYAVDINGGEAARLLGLKDSARVSSKVEKYSNFFARFIDDTFCSCIQILYFVVDAIVEIEFISCFANKRNYLQVPLGFPGFFFLYKKVV